PQQSPVGANRYPVPTAAAGHVVSVSYLNSDYRVVVEHNCDMYSVYIHVQTLAGPLAQLNGKVTFDHAWSGRIALKAGDTIAYDGQAPGYDYSLFDQRVTLKFANLASYSQSEQWKPHTVDPFTYLREPGPSELLAKDLRPAEPRGGKIDYDSPGTAAGNWFVENSNGYAGLPSNQTSGAIKPDQQHGYWDTHLALAPNPIDPTFVEV